MSAVGEGDMGRDELIGLLQKLPADTVIAVRGTNNLSGDCWPPAIRVWEYQGRLKATIEIGSGNHYNYPEGYSGVKEVTEKFFTHDESNVR